MCFSFTFLALIVQVTISSHDKTYNWQIILLADNYTYIVYNTYIVLMNNKLKPKLKIILQIQKVSLVCDFIVQKWSFKFIQKVK